MSTAPSLFFVEMQAHLIGLSINCATHCSVVYCKDTIAPWFTDSRPKRWQRLIDKIVGIDYDCNRIVFLNSANQLIGKLVLDESIHWRVEHGNALHQINAKAERRRKVWAEWKREEAGEDAPEAQGVIVAQSGMTQLGQSAVEAL